jgi:glutathione S-transferase
VPAIVDPNNGDFVLWESGAIIEYLTDHYDKGHKITPSDPKQKYQAKQWLFFQTSGQGPYFGQAAWFHFFHGEKVQTARDRYVKEIQRVTKVLDSALKGKQWLLGDQCTYADIAFLPWYAMPPRLDFEQTGWWDKTLNENPDFKSWLERLENRPALKKVQQERWRKAEEGKNANK